MSIILNINSVDKSSYVEWDSIVKNEVLTKQANTLDFSIKNYGTKTYRPALGDDVTLYNGATKIFGGVITSISESINGLAKYTDFSCKDYTEILDSQLVSKTYSSMTADDIIADIISTFTTGFTVVNVNAPITIDNIVFNYVTVSQALENITKQLNNYQWYVDFDKDIHFFDATTNLSPFDLTDSSENFFFSSLNISSDSHQIRNDIVVRGGEATSSSNRIEYFNGDGTRLIFAMGTKFNVAPTVKIGGVSKTVGRDNVDTTGYDCYWDFNQKTIRFGTAPAAGTNNVTMEGTYLYPIIIRKQSSSSITTYGLHQFLIVDKTISSIDAASSRADVELLKYSVPTNIATFTTTTAGLMAGQQININSTIRDVNEDYIIRSIRTSLKTPTQLIYSVDCQNADSIGMNDVLKKLLINNVTDQISVSANENIQRFSVFEESIAITDSVTALTKTDPTYYWMDKLDKKYSSRLETTDVTNYLGGLNEDSQLAGKTDTISKLNGTTSIGFGLSTGYQKIAQSFVATESCTITTQTLYRLANTGTPTGTITWAIYSDSGGNPNVSLASNAPTFSSMPIGSDFNGGGISYAITSGTTYWLVMTDSTLDDANHYNVAYDPSGVYGTFKRYDGAAWQTVTGTLRFAISKSSEIVLTNTISLPYNGGALFWRMKTTNTAYQNIFASSRLAGSGQIEIFDSTHLRFESNTNNNYTNNAITCGKNICDGNLHSFGLVFGASSMNLYVDDSVTPTWSKGSALTEDAVNQTYSYIGTVQQRLNGTYGDSLTATISDVTALTSEPSSAVRKGIMQSSHYNFSTWG